MEIKIPLSPPAFLRAPSGIGSEGVITVPERDPGIGADDPAFLCSVLILGRRVIGSSG